MNDHDRVQRTIQAAVALAMTARIRGRTAIRRVLGTADWKDDPERVKAAEAKRERRRQRYGGSST